MAFDKNPTHVISVYIPCCISESAVDYMGDNDIIDMTWLRSLHFSFWIYIIVCYSVPTQVEFLFQVLLGIGAHSE